MDLTRPVQIFVQFKRAIAVAFRGFLSGSGLLVSESGIYFRVLSLAVNVATFTLAASGLSISVSNLGGTGSVWVGAFARKPTVFACTKVGH